MKTKIRYDFGRTIKTGDFESARFDVGMEVMCDSEDAEAEFDRIKEWVDDKVKEEEDEWKI